jgi:antitoxin component YwqK of YwqJK toxin-antitoxin module
LENGKKQGLSQEYYRSGVIKEQGPYAGDVRQGVFTLYEESGQKRFEEIYKDGVLVQRKEYNDSGRTIMEQKFYPDARQP